MRQRRSNPLYKLGEVVNIKPFENYPEEVVVGRVVQISKGMARTRFEDADTGELDYWWCPIDDLEPHVFGATQ